MCKILNVIVIHWFLLCCEGAIPNSVDLQLYPNDAFDDRRPNPDPNNQQFKNYVSVLTRFDDWVTGHSHVRSPQEVLPDDEFVDPKPQVDPNNQQFKEYVKILTRFDPWVTGQKIPIPVDPVTDALHQDVVINNGKEQIQPKSISNQQVISNSSGNNAQVLDFISHNQETVPFDDGIPNNPPNTAFVPIPPNPETDILHQNIEKRSLISPEAHFADQFSDRDPQNPTASSAYNNFVKQLKRFDPWITGQKVPIPHDPVTDALHQIHRRSFNGNSN
ncbi:uncharacterized protein LOC129723257 isoform X2 [Wyeomyia smithii]|uniref:uncharacterized protein LOC129723257 isoform X2 n=1 Tax=Wyeomyia smithii TaxID=174621 RepID=UPI002467B749|nr:uncharacterized protein LOC129723257 isoform X2 [Wyeomyia smithii]